MLGIERVVGLSVADGQTSAGWVFLGGARDCAPFDARPEGAALYAHELYQLSCPGCTTRVTVCPPCSGTATGGSGRG